MAKLKLTARGVETLSTERRQEDFWDTLTPGLALRVSGSTGSKTWYVRYRVNGRRRRQKLGTFPRLSLAKARKRARDTLVRADAGEDPAQEREEKRQGAHTFGTMAQEVLEARSLKTRESTRRERERLLQKELLPQWGDRDVSTITRREVVHLVEGIAQRGAPTVANRTLSLIRLLFNDGLRRGFPTLEANPAHLVEPPGEEEGRDRFLEPEEIRKLWKSTDRERPATRAAFRLALLTAQRMGAVCRMRWDGISGGVWTIPAEHFKGGRTHLVPLSPEALEVIDELEPIAGSDEWIFPSRAGSKKPFVTNLSSTALKRIRDRTAIPHWVAHDFRTTFRTHALRPEKPEPGERAGLGIPAQVADAVLGHKEATVGFAHYQGEPARYLLHEKRDALRRWGAFVRKAVGGEG